MSLCLCLRHVNRADRFLRKKSKNFFSKPIDKLLKLRIILFERSKKVKKTDGDPVPAKRRHAYEHEPIYPENCRGSAKGAGAGD